MLAHEPPSHRNSRGYKTDGTLEIGRAASVSEGWGGGPNPGALAGSRPTKSRSTPVSAAALRSSFHERHDVEVGKIARVVTAERAKAGLTERARQAHMDAEDDIGKTSNGPAVPLLQGRARRSGTIRRVPRLRLLVLV